MPTPASPLLRAEALSHPLSAPSGLRGVSLAIEPARFTLLAGGPESGAGVLLRLLGLLDRPEGGEIWINDQPTCSLDEAARLDLRNHLFGYLFAEPFLLDSFSVAENVAMPLFKISGFDFEQARVRTAEVLEFAGLAAVADLGVAELSPLEHHKVSLARAIAITPRIIIAQDAGLHLPPEDLEKFLKLLRAVPDLLGLSVIATSPAAIEILRPDRVIRLEGGAIADDTGPISERETSAP